MNDAYKELYTMLKNSVKEKLNNPENYNELFNVRRCRGGKNINNQQVLL